MAENQFDPNNPDDFMRALSGQAPVPRQTPASSKPKAFNPNSPSDFATALGETQPARQAKAEPEWEYSKEYGFSTRPATVDFGNQGEGPVKTRMREDNAVWSPSTNKWWWKHPNGSWVEAPSEPMSRKSWLGRQMGLDTAKAFGRSLKAGLEKPGEALGGLAYDVGHAVGLVDEKAYIDQIQKAEAVQKYKQALKDLTDQGFVSTEFIGEAIPQLASALLLKRTLPTGPTAAIAPQGMTAVARTAVPLSERAAMEAIPAAVTTYATTPGTAEERASAGLKTLAAVPATMAGVEKLAIPVGKAIGRTLGRAGRGVKSAYEGITGQAGETATPGRSALEPGTMALPEGAVTRAPGEIPPSPQAAEDALMLSRRAGLGSKSAQRDLADQMRLNLQDEAAAKRLGMDLPADVFSDSAAIREAAGLTRSKAGLEPSARWIETVDKAMTVADDAARNFGAVFEEGRVSPSSVSNKAKQNMVSSEKLLEKESKQLYEVVDEMVPDTSNVTMERLRSTLEDVKRGIGSAELTPQEAELTRWLKSGNTTYGGMMRTKRMIGEAIAGNKSIYDGIDQATLKRYYSALAEDQLYNVSRIAGDDTASMLKAANGLHAKRKELQDAILSAYGDDISKSLTGLMKRSVTGDDLAGNMTKLLDAVPMDMHKEAIGTAIAAATRSDAAATAGKFDFGKFNKVWPAIRSNPEVFPRVSKALGQEAVRIMDDLAVVSRRIANAQRYVLGTGKANQMNVLSADRLIDRVVGSATAKAVSTGVGALGAGPAGAAGATLATEALSRMKKQPLVLIGNMFNSDQFKKLALDAAMGKPIEGSVYKLANTKPFKEYGKFIGIPDTAKARANWIFSALNTDNKVEADNAASD